MSDLTQPAVPVRHNPSEHRFEALVEGHLAVCDYRLDAGVAQLYHTAVPAALEGRGIAAALVRAALDWARTEGLRVRPSCSYVAVYMRRHPETLDLQA